MTGTFNSTGPAVSVANGYKGHITINGVNLQTTDATACIQYLGGTGDIPTATKSQLMLSGINTMWGGYYVSTSRSAIDIRAGCEVTISGSGSLTARVCQNRLTTDYSESYCAPAIGATFNNAELTSLGISGVNPIPIFAGGDLIIKSGTITAEGCGHSSGIGGGHCGGMRSIIIIGGNIKSTGGQHGSGIGGGCYSQTNGSLTVLPPTTILASGQYGAPEYAVGNTPNILYLGDLTQKKLRVTAQALGGKAATGRNNVNVLFDVSDDATISSALRLADLNPACWYAGTTGTQGYWETTGKIAGNVKIFSDTKTPSGQYYSSKKVTIPGTADVHIILEEPDMSTPWLFVTQDITAWTNKDVRLTVSKNPAVKDLTRLRAQGGTWSTANTLTQMVPSNGTFYFEAENEDGNTMMISHTVNNIDKAKPSLNVN